MQRAFYRFDFNELNMTRQKKRFLDFIHDMTAQGISIQYAKDFPPCILHYFKKYELDTIKLDNQNIVVTNNLFFGTKYKSINSLFKGSSFISESCKECKYSLDNECRGLLNAKFIDYRNILLKKLGKEVYTAVQADYENGWFSAGSMCYNNCSFCLDKLYPDKIIRYIPSLKPEEVTHFLHYLEERIRNLGVGYHCKSGELIHSPDFLEIFKIIRYFFNDSVWLLTAGNTINQKMIDLFSNTNITISLSVHTLNPAFRKNFLCENKPMDCIALINRLRQKNIKYNACIVPLKSLVENGDIFDTIEALIQNDPTCVIRISPLATARYMNEKLIKELTEGHGLFKKQIPQKFIKNIWFPEEYEIFNGNSLLAENVISNLHNSILRVCTNYKKYHLLSPEKTYPSLEKLNSRCIKVTKVRSGIGFTYSTSKILRVTDYISAIHHNPGKFDYTIVPRKSFDMYLNDISMININKLWKYVHKKQCGLILI
jgi:hypothetical protein